MRPEGQAMKKAAGNGIYLVCAASLAVVSAMCGGGGVDEAQEGEDIAAEEAGAQEVTAGPELVAEVDAGIDKAGGCAAGAACDDGNACTTDDKCDADGACAGTPLACDDGDPCNGLEECNKYTGCVPGTPLDCDDGNVCTLDGCKAPGGCTATPVEGECDDSSACTVTEACVEGKCAPTEDGDGECDDENQCTQDACDPDEGCLHSPLVTECEDGDLCTSGDMCVDGECVTGLDAVVCDDGNGCTVDSCIPETGCVFEPASPEEPCDDGNICTEGDHCQDGGCKPGPNKCGCLSQEECDEVEDGNLCNGTLFCDETVNPPACQIDPATVVKCTAPLPSACQSWVCEPSSGKCVPVPANDGKSCDDADWCTVSDKCSAGKCSGNAVPACGVGAPCKKESDCHVGLTCFASMPGGYCTDLNCPAVACPPGSVCIEINDGQMHVCANACDVSPDCRVDEGHGCNAQGGCWCGEEWCQAGKQVCDGDFAGKCNVCGSLLEPGAVDCSKQGPFCYLGQCVACKPDCAGKVCGSDGCDGSCGDCVGPQDACVNGQCVCQPACEGKQCGPDGCDGSCGECEPPAACDPSGLCAEGRGVRGEVRKSAAHA